MSAIYNDYYQDQEPERFVKGTEPSPVLMGLGLSLEVALEGALKERMFERPGEFTTPEGIAFSPDLIGFNGSAILGEMKLTWMSSREMPREPGYRSFPPKFDKWMTQMKCYGHHLEMPNQRLYALFVNGAYPGRDYSKYRPELLAWDIEFSLREMKEEWQRMLAHAKFKRMI